MRAVLIIAIGLVGMASPALAADPASGDVEDKMVCKRVQEKSTGSNFPVTRRTCMKKSEWKELADHTDRTLRKVGDQRMDPNQQSGMGGAPQ